MLDILSFIFISHLDLVSLILSLLSILLSFWFWKNPISTNFKAKSLCYKEDNFIKYVVGVNNKGWIIKKINRDISNSTILAPTFATNKNNPNIKIPPTTIEELDNLNYE